MVENNRLLWRAVEKEGACERSGSFLKKLLGVIVAIMSEEKNEQIDELEKLHAHQDELVQQGLEDMKRGRVVSHEEVLRRIRQTGRAGRIPTEYACCERG